ncbi:MAG: hypothetical protein RIC95_00345 [Vicingaceae bacterium]
MMNSRILIVLVVFSITSCHFSKSKKEESATKIEFETVKTESHELVKSTDKLNQVLILFGGYPETVEDIKKEFKFMETAKRNQIAVLYLNYNQKLWLEESEKRALAEQLERVFKENKLPAKQLFIGGFSSGGNVALLISDFLTAQNSALAPKGVFAIDSPIDLAALYKSSEKNIERGFSAPAVQESTWLLNILGKKMGNPRDSISNYEKYSVYTSASQNFEQLQHLKKTKIRLYSEPDTLWWQENRKADVDQMNGYYLDKLAKKLRQSGFNQVEYIPSKNKGYRANGERHPHSWSIVDKNDLVKWIFEN